MNLFDLVTDPVAMAEAVGLALSSWPDYPVASAAQLLPYRADVPPARFESRTTTLPGAGIAEVEGTCFLKPYVGAVGNATVAALAIVVGDTLLALLQWEAPYHLQPVSPGLLFPVTIDVVDGRYPGAQPN